MKTPKELVDLAREILSTSVLERTINPHLVRWPGQENLRIKVEVYWDPERRTFFITAWFTRLVKHYPPTLMEPAEDIWEEWGADQFASPKIRQINTWLYHSYGVRLV